MDGAITRMIHILRQCDFQGFKIFATLPTFYSEIKIKTFWGCKKRCRARGVAGGQSYDLGWPLGAAELCRSDAVARFNHYQLKALSLDCAWGGVDHHQSNGGELAVTLYSFILCGGFPTGSEPALAHPVPG
jgi:hypothetical protein